MAIPSGWVNVGQCQELYNVIITYRFTVNNNGRNAFKQYTEIS